MNGLAAATLALSVGGIALAKGTGTGTPAKTEPPNAGQGNMIHCPCVVNGASTMVKDVKDGVELTVTAESEQAAGEIRKRAKHLVDAAKTDPNSVRHTGDGHGGGGIGKCPVVLKDTLVSAEDVKGGSRIVVRPVKPVDLDWLRKETNSRQAAIAHK
jgi:hypothetical protein